MINDWRQIVTKWVLHVLKGRCNTASLPLAESRNLDPSMSSRVHCIRGQLAVEGMRRCSWAFVCHGRHVHLQADRSSLGSRYPPQGNDSDSWVCRLGRCLLRGWRTWEAATLLSSAYWYASQSDRLRNLEKCHSGQWDHECRWEWWETWTRRPIPVCRPRAESSIFTLAWCKLLPSSEVCNCLVW